MPRFKIALHEQKNEGGKKKAKQKTPKKPKGVIIQLPNALRVSYGSSKVIDTGPMPS